MVCDVAMADPIKLAPRPTADQTSRRDVVDILREALATAESGDASAIILMLRAANGDWLHYANAGMEVRTKIGALEIMKWDIIESVSRDE
jgi:hypothetical protein